MTDQEQLTQLLARVGTGDELARTRLWSVIYDELHIMAQQQFKSERGPRTMQPTALLHEAYVRLFGNGPIPFESRRHFFGAAARVMRQIRVDDARRRSRLKRGGGVSGRSLDDDCGSEPTAFDQNHAEVLAVHEVIERLAQTYPRKAEVVNLRYFAGLSVDEAAAALAIAPRTVELDWKFARAWLYQELSRGDAGFSLRDP